MVREKEEMVREKEKCRERQRLVERGSKRK